MVRVGIVGTSPRITTLADTLVQIDGFNPVGYYAGGGAELSDRHRSLLMASPNELIHAADAVLVSSPSYSFEIAQSVLRSARHLYLDIPFSVSLEQANKLNNLAHEANVKFQIGLSERLNPAFIAARQFVARPMFIEVHRLMPFGEDNAEGSIITDHMIHDLDIVLSMVRSNIKRISASGMAVVTDSPDMANVRLEFDSGCVVNLTASRISRQHICKTRIFQHNAYIAVDFLNNSYEVVQHEKKNGRLSPERLQELLSDKEYKGFKTTQCNLGETNRVKTELELFLQSIRGNKHPVVSVQDACSALSVAHKILDKIRNSSID